MASKTKKPSAWAQQGKTTGFGERAPTAFEVASGVPADGVIYVVPQSDPRFAGLLDRGLHTECDEECDDQAQRVELGYFVAPEGYDWRKGAGWVKPKPAPVA